MPEFLIALLGELLRLSVAIEHVAKWLTEAVAAYCAQYTPEGYG